jgi:hypothetical protein
MAITWTTEPVFAGYCLDRSLDRIDAKMRERLSASASEGFAKLPANGGSPNLNRCGLLAVSHYLCFARKSQPNKS